MCWNDLYNELNTVTWDTASSCGWSNARAAYGAPYYLSVPVNGATPAGACGCGCPAAPAAAAPAPYYVSVPVNRCGCAY